MCWKIWRRSTIVQISNLNWQFNSKIKTSSLVIRYYTFSKPARFKLEKNEGFRLNRSNFNKYSIIMASWSIYYFAYFGLQYSMTWIGKVIWLNFTLFGVIELIGIYLGTRLLKEFKIFVKPMGLLLFISGISCLIFQDQSTNPFFLSVLCSIKSRETVHNFVLSDSDDLHARDISNKSSCSGLYLVFFRRSVFLLEFRLLWCLSFWIISIINITIQSWWSVFFCSSVHFWPCSWKKLPIQIWHSKCTRL